MYSSELGIFISRFYKMDIDTHFYRFQFNSPTNYLDPMGDPSSLAVEVATLSAAIAAAAQKYSQAITAALSYVGKVTNQNLAAAQAAVNNLHATMAEYNANIDMLNAVINGLNCATQAPMRLVSSNTANKLSQEIQAVTTATNKMSTLGGGDTGSKVNQGNAAADKASKQGSGTNGSGKNGKFEPNDKHNKPSKDVGAQPDNGQAALDNSIPVKEGNRVAVEGDHFVDLKEHSNGKWHGYKSDWSGLRPEQQNALRDADLVRQGGKLKK
jgi:hypothetical protein